MAESQMHQQYLMFVKPLQHYIITICTTDANRPKKKGQVLKIYVAILHG